MATGDLKEALKRLVAPAAISPFALVRKARVVATHDSGGTANAANACYSIDVQPLKAAGDTDEDWPVIRDVELPLLWAGQNRGVFGLPAVGAVVRLGFYEADPGRPYIEAAIADGLVVPNHPAGSLLIQHSTGTAIEITAEGKVIIASVVGVDVVAGTGVPGRVATEAWVHQVFDLHTHPSPAGTTSPPTPTPHAGLSHARLSHD